MMDIQQLPPQGPAASPDQSSDQNSQHQPSPSPSLPTNPNPKSRPHSDSTGSIISTIAILILAPLIAVLLSMFVFQSYRVDGSSMETTLSNNNWLIVWKMPRTWARITGHQYVPARGDVVVFVGGQQLVPFGQDANKQIIKRVIALPGESVEVINGKIIVFNQQHPKGFDPDDVAPYGKVIGTTDSINTSGIVKLGKNQIFVCGDNRGGSLDSRAFGPVNLNSVVGKLAMRFLPLSKVTLF